MAKLSSGDKGKIKYFRNLLPKKIKVGTSLSEDGGYVAEILTFPGCVTQAETFAELIEMVNDAVLTVLEVPRKYLPHMPTYMPPLSLARQFNIFPSSPITNQTVTFSIS